MGKLGLWDASKWKDVVVWILHLLCVFFLWMGLQFLMVTSGRSVKANGWDQACGAISMPWLPLGGNTSCGLQASVIWPEIGFLQALEEELCIRVMLAGKVLLSFYKAVEEYFSSPEPVPLEIWNSILSILKLVQCFFNPQPLNISMLEQCIVWNSTHKNSQAF